MFVVCCICDNCFEDLYIPGLYTVVLDTILSSCKTDIFSLTNSKDSSFTNEKCELSNNGGNDSYKKQ